MPALSLGRVTGNDPRTQNTSRSTAISDKSAGSTPRWDQAGQRSSHFTWSLDDLWVAFPWV